MNRSSWSPLIAPLQRANSDEPPLPPGAVWTLWLSTMAAEGLLRQPSACLIEQGLPSGLASVRSAGQGLRPMACPNPRNRRQNPISHIISQTQARNHAW
jgi:hypothetical protein